MPKPQTVAVLNKVSSVDYSITVSTEGTRAAPSAKIIKWVLYWGDDSPAIQGSNSPPINLSYDYKQEGTYSIFLLVKDSKNFTTETKLDVMIVRGPLPLPPTISRGPTPEITCSSTLIPAGSTAASRQALINGAPTNSAFCLQSGVHIADGSVTPKAGDIFTGQYGAILDGATWIGAGPTDGAFNAYGSPVNNVSIRNILFRNMPQKSITVDPTLSTGWTIDHNEFASGFIGIEIPKSTMVSNNKIHHQTRGGYSGFEADDSVFDNNEINNNGTEQKVGLANNLIFRNNWVHHNAADGIWYDTILSPGGILVENNICEDNGRDGISLEACNGGIVRNNITRRNAEGILLAGSQSIEITGHTSLGDTIGITFFVDLDDVSAQRDLQNNNVHNNTITVPAGGGNFAINFSHIGSIASPIPYENNSKANNLDFNTYHLINLTDFVWLWWAVSKNWAGWQAIPQDLNGTHVSP
jgi:parallel beta-helix repeat protein